MDGVSAVLGIASAIPALIATCRSCIDMAITMKDAYEDCRMLSYELYNLLALLQALDEKMKEPQSPLSKHIALDQNETPLHRMKVRLEALKVKLTPKPHLRSFNRVRWYLNQEYVKELLAALERDKLLINLALQADSKALEQALRTDVQDVHTFLRDMDKRIGAALEGQSENISELKQMTSEEASRAKARETAQERKEILQWLSTPDEDRSTAMKRQRRGQSAPGGWLLQSTAFNSWASGDDKLLHAFGKPGSGKSMLSSIVVDHLEGQYQGKPIACVFCESSKAALFTEEDMLRSILRQFLDVLPEIPEDLRQAYLERRDSEKHASPDTVEAALEKLLVQQDRVFIVVDALDEFGDDIFSRDDVIDNLTRLLDHEGVKLMVTSVTGTIQLPEVSAQTELEIQAHDDDIKEYVKVVLQRRRTNAAIRDLMDKIIERISVVAEGIFLSAKMLAEQIYAMKLPTQDKILKVLGDPPKTLNQRYEEALRRVGDSEEVLSMLAWLAKAHRDLTSKELLDALAIEEGQSDIDRVDMSVLHELVQNSAGLAILDENGVVRLLHRTVKKFLLESQVCANSGLKITKACLTYLCYDQCVQPLNQHNKLSSVERKYPFLQYAARYWGEHYKDVAEEDRALLNPQLLEFANKPCRAADAYMGHFAHRVALRRSLKIWKGGTYNRDKRSLHMMSGPRPRARWSGAHYAIFFGAFSMLKLFADNGVDLHQNLDRTGPLLTLAATLDRVKAAQFLIKQGVDVNVRDWTGAFPLFKAVESGSMEMVQLLIDAGADIHQTHDDGKTVLHQACFYDRDDIVDLLWRNGADADIDEGRGSERIATPLAFVMDKGRARCRELLLFKHKAFTPFNAIGLNVPIESPDLLKRLLEQGTDPNQQYGQGESALDVALRLQDPVLINTILEKGGRPRLYWKEEDPKITIHASEPWYQNLQSLLNTQSKPYFTASRSDPVIVHTHRNEYLKFQIPTDAPPPKRMMLTITSHDQGKSSFPETWGAYRGSQTFFVARIYERDEEKDELKEILYPRFIVRNVHASSVSKTHTVMWDIKDKKKGWAKWMGELKAGRVVHVNARSQGEGLGWENHVHGVRVDLFHE